MRVTHVQDGSGTGVEPRAHRHERIGLLAKLTGSDAYIQSDLRARNEERPCRLGDQIDGSCARHRNFGVRAGRSSGILVFKDRGRVTFGEPFSLQILAASAAVSGGNWGAMTLYPSDWRRSMTPLRQDPTAHAPWMRMMFGREFISVSLR